MSGAKRRKGSIAYAVDTLGHLLVLSITQASEDENARQVQCYSS